MKLPPDQLFLGTTIADQGRWIRARLMDVATVSPDRAAMRLVRPANKPAKGTVLGVPGLGGNAPFLGTIAAHILRDYDIWTFELDLRGRELTHGDAWLDAARLLAERLLMPETTHPKALIGFSIGAFVAWLANRMLLAAGAPSIPVINFDGGLLWSDVPDWERRVADLPRCDDAIAMMLLRRAPLPRFAIPEEDDLDWVRVGVKPRTYCCNTLSHLDFHRPTLLLAYAATLESFVDGHDAPAEGPAPPCLATPGGRLHTLLSRADTVVAPDVLNFVTGLPDGPVDPELRVGLLFLALVAGDAMLTQWIVNRLQAEEPTARDAVYAHVAMLSQAGRHQDARERAERWCAGQSDPDLMARARERRVGLSWDRAAGLLTGGDDAAMDLAASLWR